MMPVIGERFGRGVVIREVDRNIRRRRMFELKCDCGNLYSVCVDNLNCGRTNSCGCLRTETSRKFKNPNKKPYGVANFYNLYRLYKFEATRRKLTFSLSEEKFAELTKQNCFYCGVEPSGIHGRNHGNGEYVYNGIDRLDNSIGYEVDNVVPCCKTCNFAKHTMTVNEFKEWIARVYNHTRAEQDVR